MAAIVTLPTSHTKTWQWTFNSQVSTAGTSLADHRANALRFKNLLIGISQNPWTVRGSSDAVTAGMDGVDRWSSSSNIVAAAEGVAHSWICLRQTGVGSTFDLLFNFGVTASNAQLADVLLSSVGFTGGTTTARPTATDEVYLLEGAGTVGWLNGSGSGFSTRVNVHQSTDGQNTRVIIFQGGVPILFFAVDRLADARTNVSNPWSAVWISGSTSDVMTASITTSNSGLMRVRGLPRGRPARLGWAFPQNDGRPDPTNMSTNAISGDRPFWPILVGSLTHRCLLGRVVDMYQGASNLSGVDGAPSGGPRIWQAYGGVAGAVMLAHDATLGTPNGTALITS